MLDLLNSGPDGGFCPSIDNCRGYSGTCGQLPDQFATVPVMPDYPNGLQDYTCTAFPDDDNSVDAFLVGLISVAIGAAPAVGCVRSAHASRVCSRTRACVRSAATQPSP